MAGPPPGRHPGSPPRSGPQPLRVRPPVPPPGRLPSSAESRAHPPAARGPAGARPPAPRRRPGRLRRFVTRHGWRAYAIPLLTVATVLVLADVVGWGRATPSAPAGGASAPAGGASAPAGGASAPTGGASATPAPATSSSTGPTEQPTEQPPAPAEGDANPTGLAPVPGTFVEQGAGSVTVVPGTSAVYGTGPLQRFVVEVEDGIGVDGAAFAAAVEATLGDPRSWGNGGAMSFQRVDATAPGAYDFRVSLVSPGSMERYCPGVGTGGYTSCRYGERAVVNLARWETAVPDYQGDVATYRQYVVNHEVGHALGNGHEPCPGPGQLAPVMQQQTLGLDGCQRNAWPFP